jgi:DNA modification methylase
VYGYRAERKRPIQSKSSSGSGVYQFNVCEAGSQSMKGGYAVTHKDGLWPANLIHDGGDEKLRRYFYSTKANDDDRPHGKGAILHPTVKPLDLMRYLVRLVCAPGGTVLDPFMGSGSTGCAAVAEGMRFVGIEQSIDYADIAVGRLRLALAARGGKENTPPPPARLRGV